MKVSIIIPVYNGEKYLEKCLDSVINQTYNNIEIIIINDGSKDESLNIINRYIMNDKRILLINKENEGQARARNLGLKKATGDYVLFVDCDDYIEKEMVDILLDVSKINDSDIVSSDLQTIEATGIKKIIKGLNSVSDDNSINFMLSDVGPCGKLFKMTYLKQERFKFLENRIYEDLATIPALALNTDKIEYVNCSYYNYVLHDESTMKQKFFSNKLNDIFYSLENLEKKFDGKYFDELEYIFIKHLLHDASLRFLNFDCKESKQSLNKIINIMKEKFPNWKKNKYINLMEKKEILLTKIIYNKLYMIYKIYREVTKS